MMLDEAQIREAVIGDEAALAALCADVQALHCRQRPAVFKQVDMGGLEAWFRDALTTQFAKIWIAQAGPVPAAYTLVVQHRRPENIFCHPRRWFEIEQIGVHPQHRRQGLATRLVRHVIETAVAEGIKEIELNTWSFNESAQRAFQRMGLTVKNIRYGLGIAE